MIGRRLHQEVVIVSNAFFYALLRGLNPVLIRPVSRKDQPCNRDLDSMHTYWTIRTLIAVRLSTCADIAH